MRALALPQRTEVGVGVVSGREAMVVVVGVQRRGRRHCGGAVTTTATCPRCVLHGTTYCTEHTPRAAAVVVGC